MTLEEMAAKIEELEKRLCLQEDIEEIKTVQRMYGYYVDNHMLDDAIDLFADDAESVEISDHGVFKGKSGITKFFKDVLGKGGQPLPPWALFLVLQHQGVVHVDTDGKTAKGRWHGWMAGVIPESGLPRQFLGHGIYENEYMKERGKWRIKKLYFNLTFRAPYEDGWLKTPVIGHHWNGSTDCDSPPTAYRPYPSGYKVPLHWKDNALV